MPGFMHLEDPQKHLSERYQLDYLPSGAYVWAKQAMPDRTFSTDALGDEILKWLFDNGGDPIW
jgi:hypothetical protein